MLDGNKALNTLYIFNGIFVFAAAMLTPIYALYAEHIGATLFIVSTLTAVFLLSRVFFTLLVRVWGDSIHEKEYLLLAGFFIRAIAWFSLVFADSVIFLYVIQILLGLGEAVGTPSFHAIFAKHLDTGKRISEYASWDIVATVSMAIGTLLGGYVVSIYGFETLFIIMSILALISFVGILIKPRELL